jgi:hypothetical protein
MIPFCPFCHREMTLIGQNETGIRFGCDPCLVYLFKSSPRKVLEVEQNSLMQVGEIKIQKGASIKPLTETLLE